MKDDCGCCCTWLRRMWWSDYKRIGMKHKKKKMKNDGGGGEEVYYNHSHHDGWIYLGCCILHVCSILYPMFYILYSIIPKRFMDG